MEKSKEVTPTAGPVRVNTSRQILVHDPGGFLAVLMERTN
jgi:hypothetical protein